MQVFNGKLKEFITLSEKIDSDIASQVSQAQHMHATFTHTHTRTHAHACTHTHTQAKLVKAAFESEKDILKLASKHKQPKPVSLLSPCV